MRGVGSFKPLTFLGNGRPVSPSPPGNINRTGSKKGITYSGNTAKELKQIMNSESQMSPRQLGQGAVRLSKSMGLSINTTI